MAEFAKLFRLPEFMGIRHVLLAYDLELDALECCHGLVYRAMLRYALDHVARAAMVAISIGQMDRDFQIDKTPGMIRRIIGHIDSQACCVHIMVITEIGNQYRDAGTY